MSPALPTSCTPRAADVLETPSSTTRRAQPVDKATSRIFPPNLHLIIGVCCADDRGHFFYIKVEDSIKATENLIARPIAGRNTQGDS